MALAPELIAAYEKAEYAAGGAVLRVGERNDAMDALLAKHGVSGAAYLSAANPRSERLPELHNAARFAVLEAAVRKTGRFYVHGEARDPQGAWPAEQGLLVLGIGCEEAAALGRTFEQNAIVYIERGKAPELVLLVS